MTDKELYKLIRKLTKRRLRLMRKATYGDFYGYPQNLAAVKRRVSNLENEIKGYEKKLKACQG